MMASRLSRFQGVGGALRCIQLAVKYFPKKANLFDYMKSNGIDVNVPIQGELQPTFGINWSMAFLTAHRHVYHQKLKPNIPHQDYAKVAAGYLDICKDSDKKFLIYMPQMGVWTTGSKDDVGGEVLTQVLAEKLKGYYYERVLDDGSGWSLTTVITVWNPGRLNSRRN